MGEWISVKERLPDEESDVLVLVREIERYGRHNEKRNIWRDIYKGYQVDGEWWTSYCFGCKQVSEESTEKCELKVTHWMPMPELPKTKEEAVEEGAKC